MVLSFPDTAREFLVMIVPLLTLLLAMAFLLVPRRVFRFMGLEARPEYPEAIGEGRSSFAGSMFAVSLGCLLLQDPIALQPGLNFTLALGWSLAACGRILQIVFDAGWRKRVQVRLILAIGMSMAAWSVTEIPIFQCFEASMVQCGLFDNGRSLFLNFIAVFTFGLGLIAFLMPNLALKILRMQTSIKTPFAKGETRGTLAGFYMAIGITYLLSPQPIEFTGLVMGGAWLLTGIGRAISMIFDRGWTLYNTLGVVLEVLVGLAVISITLRII